MCRVKKEESFIDTRHWAIVLALDQTYLGRCLVILRRHAGDLSQLTKSEQTDLFTVVKKFENAARNTFGATMFNWSCLMNDAFKEKHPEPHVHWHVRPRYKSKVKFAGLTFADEEFGSHYNREVKREVPSAVKARIITVLRKEFNQV